MAVAHPPEGHGGRFFSSLPSDSSLSSTAPFGGGGIPVESFLSVMKHLSEKDLVQASHVCSNWRKAVVGCSKLWNRLDGVNVASMNSLDRVRAFVTRSKGKLRKLSFEFEPQGDLELSMMPIVPLLRQMYHEISRHDGARSLFHLSLDLRPYRNEDSLDPAFEIIALTVSFAELSAVNLTDFKLITVLPRFPAGAVFWYSLTELKTIVITSRGPDEGRQLPDFFSTSNAVSSTQLTTSKLEKIFFVNTSLRDVTYPTFTNLVSLRLHQMSVPNLYGLLSKCASTLETLELRQASSDSPFKYLHNPNPIVAGLPNNNANANRDVPPVLSLPQLKKVQICGHETPLLWVVPIDGKTSFMCDTPSLVRVDFGPKSVCRYTEYDDGDDDDFAACQDLDSTVLVNLFRRSPNLEAINFKRTNLETSMLVSALPDASSSLTHLSIGGTNACQDELVDRLPSLVPQLEELDCFDEDWVGSPSRNVSIQALGRYAKAMLDAARRGGNEGVLEITAESREYGATSAKELENSLRNLLVTLSTSQFSHLGSQLVFKSCPTPQSFPASTLTFSSIKAELEELITLPPEPPFKDPFPAKPGEQGFLKYEASTSGGSKKKPVGGLQNKKKKRTSKIAAPQDVVDQTETLLQQWVTARERDACLAWFEELEDKEYKDREGGGGINLRFGYEGCGDEDDYSCCRVGGEMWKEEKEEESSDESEGEDDDEED